MSPAGRDGGAVGAVTPALATAVLAAGAGTRLGGPKALTRWRGRPFLDHVLARVAAAGVGGPVVVVTGAAADEVAALAEAAGALALHNPDWSRGGMLSSLLAAIASPAVAAAAEGLLVWPVDHPAVRPETVAALVAAWRRTRAPVVTPRRAGRGGHPVVFDAGVWPALREAPEGEGARAVVRALGPRVLRIPVDDPGVRLDVDTPEALARLRALEPQAP